MQVRATTWRDFSDVKTISDMKRRKYFLNAWIWKTIKVSVRERKQGGSCITHHKWLEWKKIYIKSRTLLDRNADSYIIYQYSNVMYMFLCVCSSWTCFGARGLLDRQLNMFITREHNIAQLKTWWHIDGLAKDLGNSISNALDLLQCCAKPSLKLFSEPMLES